MKTIFLSTVMLAMSVANAGPMASDTTKEINAQTTITRGQIDNILDKMNRQNNQSAFKASDYYAQTGAFKENVERVLRNFEDKISKVILPKAAFWMDQYNSIYSSNEFSGEQKRMILKERKNHLDNQFEMLSKEYQEALKSVYALIPGTMFKITFKYFPETLEYKNGTSITENIKVRMILNEDMSVEDKIVFLDSENTLIDITFSNGRHQDFSNSKPGIVFKDFNPKFSRNYTNVSIDFSKMEWLNRYVFENIKDIYKTLYYPVIKGKCESTICVGLRSADLLTLMSLIEDQIDRDINLKLLDGNYLKLKGLDLYVFDLSKNLSRVDYPEELPFDL
ncbi:MAG: hypothetical protein KBD76_15760 [Bacteriovorax sp.]|nr:hypothetical protein [Bacteriovorax sp.]